MTKSDLIGLLESIEGNPKVFVSVVTSYEEHETFAASEVYACEDEKDGVYKLWIDAI